MQADVLQQAAAATFPVIPDVILLGGAPGVGKSTLARLLRAVWPQGATVEVDRIRSMRNFVSWTDQVQHAADLRAAARHVHCLLRIGLRPILVVDAFNGPKSEWFTDEFDALGGGFSFSHVVLYADPLVLNDRVTARPPGGFTELPICLQINEECRLQANSSMHTFIGTSVSSPELVLDEFLGRLRS